MNILGGLSRAFALLALSFLAAANGNPGGFASGGVSSPATDAKAASIAAAEAGPCVADALTLCLNGGRFQVRVNWSVPSQGTSGVGTGVALTGDTGYFWFFSPNNIELVLKVVDGRAFNGMFWVFYGALSNVQYSIVVTDTATGAVKTYANPSGNLASVADTAAFIGGNSVVAGDEEAGNAAPQAGPAPDPSTLLIEPAESEAACSPSANTLCLNGGRFKVEVEWRVPSQGTHGNATAVPLTSDTGQFWFFSANNIELVIKALDGTPVNGNYWIFYGALSNVGYTITVTDTVTGYVKTFVNPEGNLASVADVSGFAPPASPTAPPPTATPTPPASPTPTPTSGGSVRIVNVGSGGVSSFRDAVSNSSTTTIRVGDTVRWNFVTSSYHSATSGTCTSGGDPYGGGYENCTPDGPPPTFDSGQLVSPATYSKTFTSVGSYPYYCSIHGGMMTGLVIVNP